MKVLVMTAFVRNPSAITERSDRLRVFHGDARDSAAIDRADTEKDMSELLCTRKPVSSGTLPVGVETRTVLVWPPRRASFSKRCTRWRRLSR